MNIIIRWKRKGMSGNIGSKVLMNVEEITIEKDGLEYLKIPSKKEAKCQD